MGPEFRKLRGVVPLDVLQALLRLGFDVLIRDHDGEKGLVLLDGVFVFQVGVALARSRLDAAIPAAEDEQVDVGLIDPAFDDVHL